MCRALQVSKSGYYASLSRSPSKMDKRRGRVEQLVKESYSSSHNIYGYRKVHRDIVNRGLETCCADTVRKTMQRLGLRSRRARKYVRTTDSNHNRPVADNLLERDFSASSPNEKWLADISYIPTQEGWLYLAVVLDCFSRRIVGWSMSESIDAEIVCAALRMAISRRGEASAWNLIHHSDRGVQYASEKLGRLISACGIQLSMSRKGDPWDNSMMESFFNSLKTEWITSQYKTRKEAELDVFTYIEMFYNTSRLHESLDYISPLDFERNFEENSIGTETEVYAQ
jgi:putative transposase